MRSHPPEVRAEVDRLAKICREDQDVIVTEENGNYRVYLQQSAPLVSNPQNWAEEITFLKHHVRSGSIDMKRLAKSWNREPMSYEELFLNYSNSDLSI